MPASSIRASARKRPRAVGSKGVLEVRSHETPFLLEDGQTVARLVYEPLALRPARLYGEGGSTISARA
jgi:deoxycytidine triphosphate deaminase